MGRQVPGLGSPSPLTREQTLCGLLVSNQNIRVSALEHAVNGIDLLEAASNANAGRYFQEVAQGHAGASAQFLGQRDHVHAIQVDPSTG